MSDYTTISEPAVLYVDDEEMALKYFRRALAKDVAVHTATSVDQAIELLVANGREIGVLVTDQRMPGKPGVELLRRVRRDWPHIIRLLTTAYSDLDDAIDAVNRGEIFRYITKPWDVKLLRAEISQALEVFRLRREYDLLMREKLSVWQRLIGVNRIRDLVIMAGSITHLRNAPAAVEAFFNAGAPGHERPNVASSQALDLWGLTESEIGRSLAFIEALVDDTLAAEGQDFGDRVTPATLFESGAPAAEQTASSEALAEPLQVNRALAERMVAGLSDMVAATPLIASATRSSFNQQDVCALSLRTEDGGSVRDPEEPTAGPFAAYLIAHHHGGCIERIKGGYRALLPLDPRAAPAQEPTRGWLEGVLAEFEDWD